MDRRGGRGVAEAVRGASSFRRLVLFGFLIYLHNTLQSDWISVVWAFSFSARYCGDSAAVAEQRQPHSTPGRDPVGAHGAGR